MTIKQTMGSPINKDPGGVAGIVNEASDGIKAIPAEIVLKAADDSTFSQVSQANPLPVSGTMQLTGSYVQYEVTTNIWLGNTSLRRVVGQNEKVRSSSSSGAGFLPIPLEKLEKLCFSLVNPSESGTFSGFRILFYDSLTPNRSQDYVNFIPLDITIPASGRLLLDLTPYLYAFKGLGLEIYPRSDTETLEYTYKFRGWRG